MLSIRFLRGGLAALLLLTASSVASAQTFANVPALSFTKTFGGANPLPQTVAIASTGANFNVTTTVTTSTGGSWLAITPGSGIYSTPAAYIVSVNPTVSLAAGTYSGQIVFAEYSAGTPKMTVPVSLIITAAGAAFFDDTSGQVSFSMVPGGKPPAQVLQIRNGGPGTLSWTGSVSTADGGNWLSVSATAGNAPSLVTVSLTPASLPGGGATAGTFVGQLMFQATGCSHHRSCECNGRSQCLWPGESHQLHHAVRGRQSAATGTADPEHWHKFQFLLCDGGHRQRRQLAENQPVSLVSTRLPKPSPSASAPPRSRPAPIPAKSSSSNIPANNLWITVPVTLTIAAPGTTFFDNLPGELSYFMTPGGGLPAQQLQIRNGGTGTLHWTGCGDHRRRRQMADLVRRQRRRACHRDGHR